MFLLILLFILLFCSFLSSSALMGFLQINAYDLQAKARAGNTQAKKLYPLHKQGYQIVVLLVFDVIIVHLALLATTITVCPIWVVILLTPFVVLMSGFILPLFYADKIGLYLLAWKPEWILKFLRYTSIVIKPLATFVEKRLDMHTPQLLGSKQELYKLLEKHTESSDSVIADHEIELIRHALDFSSKQVRDFMIPRRVVKRIASHDEVGPILVDELHTSGHSRFPVYDEKQVDSFIGILFLRDLVDVRNGGSVQQFMNKTVIYIHEEESLYHALQVILKTNQQMLIVVNTFEEFVGVITIEDILEQIIGAEIVDEFDQHDDLRAVAARNAEKDAKERAITDKK